ncbi:hypothetical protein ACFSCX_06260 [Bacillus salitolerans]|uniref:Uncharacterized protein n=1 Tax=Bacillus salitolerans TaxID=1437434 RepID=A0ABW4LPY5_9BACI
MKSLSEQSLIVDIRQEESPCHNIIYTLKLETTTYEYEGYDVLKILEDEKAELLRSTLGNRLMMHITKG